MFYNKLQGTTSSSFRLGKNGVNIETLQGGELRIVTKDYEFVLGKSEVEELFEGEGPRSIASWQVVENYIVNEIQGIVGDVTGVEEALQQISGIAAALDNDPDFYLHVLRLQDVDGNAVDGQTVKGTTTFEKDVTFGGKIIGPSTLTIDPLQVDALDPNNPNLGTVVIHGNLQVDGTTTTINSQTVDIFDKNITLAFGATNSAAADGAGITIDGANANLTYLSSGDKFSLNKSTLISSTTTTGNALEVSANSLTTGSALSLSTTSTGRSSSLFRLSSSGNHGSLSKILRGINIDAYDYGTNVHSIGLDIEVGDHGGGNYDQNITDRSTGLQVEVNRSLKPMGFYFGAQSENSSANVLGGRIFAQGYGDNSNSVGLEVLSYSISKTPSANLGESYGIIAETVSLKDPDHPGTGRDSYALYLMSEAPEQSKAYAIYSLLGLNYLAGNTGIGQLPGTEKLEVTGNTKSEQFVSTVTTASTRAPMIVSSKVLVQNLNADQLDGADLETVLTSDSDSKVPTSKAVADFAVSRMLTGYTTSEYDNATLTSDKLNSFVYVLNQSGVSVKVRLSDILRPSLYTVATNSEIDSVKVGDFVYTEKGGI
jgi:hypothetical protein